MKSPFPGMDPYLEQRWSDFHGTLLPLIRETLQPVLPAGLRARIEKRVLLEAEGESLRRYRGDIAVVETAKTASREQVLTAAGPARLPVVIEFSDEPMVDRFVQIIDTSDGGRVVTAIELLSDGNKSAGFLNRLYRRKLRDYARGKVNMVEIDLLRSSRKRLRITTGDPPVGERAAYLFSVLRAGPTERWECYPIELRQPIPPLPVPVPLRETDSDVMLDLQPLVERVYVGGAHDDIDYTQPLDPPLSAEDEAWVDQLLRTAGRR